MKIIEISGKSGHGKDETAKILKSKLEYIGNKVIILHFADQLKYIAAKYYDWDFLKDEKGRTLLQTLGVSARNRNKDYWVNIVYEIIITFFGDMNYVIIPDVRFLNEIYYLENKGFDVTTLRVTRLNFENNLTEEQRNHVSEIELDDYKFDYYLYSENNLEHLNSCIDTLLSNLVIEAY